nr:piggyBac transposable element-derived protein 4-like [Helicoverpa armigera]XP_049696923.1 piggyBac transposable element-derived protein 4-like [Helicoverpa armigera]XP_049708119.1 piggyBac transposable element-derived protein 4-like [Helicoverpa armigera]
MAENARKRGLQPSTSSKSKVLRVDSPSFEEELNALLLASDQSDSEGDIEEFLVSDRELLQLRESDQDEDLEENISSNVGSEITREGDSTDSSDDALPLSEIRNSNFYYGKNRYKWSKTPPNTRVRTLQHNIITHACGSKLTSEDAKDPLSIWHKLFDEEMLQQVLTWTNKKIASYRMKFARQNKPELKDIDLTELKAFVGLLLYSAVLKSNHERTSYLFARDGTGCEIFRCGMSENRFVILLLCLRFDNPDDRAERQNDDKLAAISFIFNKFVNNSQQQYELSECVTVDEMLVKFRGRSHMISYMPKKPGKYGLVIQSLCDAKNAYFYNGYVYTGKGSHGVGLTTQDQKHLVPTQCVLRLIQPIEGSNRNVTADNWYSSIELIDELAKRKLTYVGTMKKNKREIPSQFQPQKDRDVQSTLFGFTKQNTMCSYVPKKNKAVILVSSMHHDVVVDEDTKKPEIILYYNMTKGGVDEADKKCSIYSSSRRTRRWPMVVFYRILDLSGMNAYILYNMHQPKNTDRGDFLKSLARSLVLPHLQRRVVCKQLPRELRLVIKRVLAEDMVEEDIQSPETSQGKRRACSICPPKLHRMTVYTCVGCCNPVCLQCSRPLCKNCQ